MNLRVCSRASLKIHLLGLAVVGFLLPRIAAAQSEPLGGAVDQSLHRQPEWSESEPPDAELEVVPLADDDLPRGDQKLHVNEIRVVGDRILTRDELWPLIAPYEGKDLTLADLTQAARNIADYYRRNGHPLTRAFVPKQKVGGGIVEIRVIEAELGNVLVSGNEHYSTEFILSHFESSGPLDLGGIERGVLRLNRLAGLKASAQLRPGDGIGLSDLYVEVQDQPPFRFTAEYDNFGPESSGEHRLGSTFRWGNVGKDGRELMVRLVGGTGDGDVIFGQVSYAMPFASGLELTLYASIYDYEAEGFLGSLDPLGDGSTIGVTVSYPLVEKRFLMIEVEGGLEAKSVEQELSGTTTAKDDIRVLTAAVRLDAPWQGGGRWLAALQLRKGLAGFAGGMDDGDPLASRFGADADFMKVILQGYRLHKLGAWLSAIVKVTAQFASEPLLVSEQFPLGGADSVRGYPPFEYMADSGYVATAEFRIPLLKGTSRLQAAAFYDRGKGEREDTMPGETKEETLSGYGVGVRFEDETWGSIRFDVAKPSGSPDPSNGDDTFYYLSVLVNVE